MFILSHRKKLTCLYNQDKRANLARFIFYKIYIGWQIVS